jgi:hypothetical protein
VHDRRAEAGALDRARDELDTATGGRADAPGLARGLTPRGARKKRGLLRVVERAQQRRRLGRNVALRLGDDGPAPSELGEDLRARDAHIEKAISLSIYR